jgi:hypothetical protein
MGRLVSSIDKIGVGGVIVAALSCAGCFPALGASRHAWTGLSKSVRGNGNQHVVATISFYRAGSERVWLVSAPQTLAWRNIHSWPSRNDGYSIPSMAVRLEYLLVLLRIDPDAARVDRGFDLARKASLQDCTGGIMIKIVLESEITCPTCDHRSPEVMPTDACQWFYECKGCHAILKPRQGDCCVYCSYGSVKCPPIQAGRSCGG